MRQNVPNEFPNQSFFLPANRKADGEPNAFPYQTFLFGPFCIWFGLDIYWAKQISSPPHTCAEKLSWCQRTFCKSNKNLKIRTKPHIFSHSPLIVFFFAKTKDQCFNTASGPNTNLGSRNLEEIRAKSGSILVKFKIKTKPFVF